jgi:2-polyprenyl-6-methoxyphenol hydroxylase-like FAD-dependent oxidoreductase
MNAEVLTPVLIVGAGPTGLTMATELARRGIAVRIIDAADAPSQRSKAMGVQARTLEVFEHLGVVGEALARGRPVHGVNVYAAPTGDKANEPAARVVHVGFDDLDTPYPFILSLPQSDTEEILIARCAELGVAVERAVRCTGLKQDADGVHVALEHIGDGGRVEAARATWVIGCDGAHSAVRKALAVPFEGAKYDEEFVLADVLLEWDRPDDEAHAFLSLDGVLVFLPLSSPAGVSRWRIVADLPTLPEGKKAPEPTLGRMQTLVESRGARDAVLREASWTTNFTIHRRMVPRYRTGRVFLAGDAAHIHSPVGGQGMNTGIQDAYNLAWKLALVLHGAASASLLDSYHLERHPVASVTVSGTDLATRMVTLRSPVAREVRDRLGGLLTSLEPVQRRLTRATSEIDLSYAKSAIVAEDRTSVLTTHLLHDPSVEAPSISSWIDFGAGPRAGERAPDITFGPPGQERRVFSLLHGTWHERGDAGAPGTGHTLLLFDGAAATAEGYANLGGIARKVEERWGRLVDVHVVVPRKIPPERAALGWEGSVLLDPDAALHRRYGAGAECLYLIRPDGYVAYRAQPADAAKLERFLGRIFL